MSNNNFFNTFLKKDKLFQQTQNNPIYKKTFHEPHYLSSWTARITNADGTPIYGPGDFDAHVPIHPPPAVPTRTRIPFNSLTKSHKNRYDDQIDSIVRARQRVMDEDGISPAAGANLPDPINAATINQNKGAMFAVGNFDIVDPVWEARGYWFPDYQGKFTNITTPNSIQPKYPFHSDTRFIPQNYLNNKQKEGFVWLDFGNYSFHKNRNAPIAYP